MTLFIFVYLSTRGCTMDTPTAEFDKDTASRVWARLFLPIAMHERSFASGVPATHTIHEHVMVAMVA